MPREIVVDLRGAPPAQGGGVDHIPPDLYRLKCTRAEQKKSSTDKDMIVASFRVVGGDHNGARLMENFVMQGESKFGLQRLHAFLLAINLPVKEARFKLDLDLLTDKECMGEVVDNKIPAKDGKPERISSTVNAFLPVPSKAAAAKNGATAPAAAAPAAEEDEPESVSVTVEASGEAEVEDEVEDLFK